MMFNVNIAREVFEDVKSIIEERVKSYTTPFISQEAPEKEWEVSLIEALDIPEPFKHSSPHEIKEIFIKFSSDSLPTPEILFENVVVEYKSFVDKESVHQHGIKELKVTYLKTFVSVGIPNGQFQWLTTKLIELTNLPTSIKYTFKDKDYTWVSAQLLIDDVVHEEAKCYVYDTQTGTSVPVGNLYDVLTGLKSNLIGFAQFRVRRMLNFRERSYTSLLLTGFQIVAKTDRQSYPKPCVPVPATASITESLKKLNLSSR